MKRILPSSFLQFRCLRSLLALLLGCGSMVLGAQTTPGCTPPADIAVYQPPGGIDGRFEAAFVPVGHVMNGNESVVAIRGDGQMVGPATCVSQEAGPGGQYFFRQIKVTRTLDCVTDVESVLGPSEGNPAAQALIAQCEAGKNEDRSLQVVTPGEYEGYQFVMYDPDGGGRYYRIDNGGGLFGANDADIDFLSDAIALPEQNPVDLNVPAQSFGSLAEAVAPPTSCSIPADIAVYDPPAGIDGRFEAAFIPLGHPMNGNESVVAVRGDGRMVGPGKCVSYDADTDTYFFEEIKVTRTLDCVTDVESILGPSEGNPTAQTLIAQCEANKNEDRSLQVLTPGVYEGYQFVMYDPDGGGRYYRIDDDNGAMFPADDADIDFLSDAIALPQQNPVGLQVPADFSGSLEESALPVEFVSFTATLVEGSTQLDWVTATESENDYFEVQRSLDGGAFTAIGRVAGAGDSRVELHYRFHDVNPGAGYSYYRLKQVDYDGTSAYSEVASVRTDEAGAIGLKLFPNPAAERVVILTDRSERETTVRLHDLTGRVVRQWILPKNADRLSVDLGDLARGTYTIRTTTEGTINAARLVKQ